MSNRRNVFYKELITILDDNAFELYELKKLGIRYVTNVKQLRGFQDIVDLVLAERYYGSVNGKYYHQTPLNTEITFKIVDNGLSLILGHE